MLTLPGEAHFWTLKDDISIPETDFGAYRYHEKRDAVESLYLESKKSYAAGRGITWAVSNKKSSPVKKEALRDLEELLGQQRVVRCEWRRHDVLTLLLSSGLLVNVAVNLGTGDIAKISTDKFLLGKLPSECLTDVVYGKAHILLAFSDSVVSVVHLSRPQLAPEKLSRQEPRLSTFDLGGPSGRRLERVMSLSAEQNMVLVWWKCAQDEVYPWSPVVRDCDRANLLVYSIAGPRLELLCFYKTEADPVSVSFSKVHPNVIHLVEQRVSRKGEVTVESSQFEVCGSRLSRSSSVGALQLQTQVCCVARSPDETRLALGCIDGSVLLQSGSSSLLAKAAFIPSLITWHPDGTLVVAANEKGQLQSFDLALAPVRVQLLSEEPGTSHMLDLTVYFRYQPTLCSMLWNKKAAVEEFNAPYAPSDGFLLMYFERGPLTVLRLVGGGGLLGAEGGLAADSLVAQYLRLDLADAAINLLASLSWNSQGAESLACMHCVCNHLLSQHLTPAIEEQLEAALGTFMSPSVPLSLAAERKFGQIIHHLARKFFHHLLRYQRFDKAFRLAMDLGDRDLFMDIFHYARALGDEALALAAREKASEVAQVASSGSSSTSSSCQCSRSSCSECGSASPSPSSSDSETQVQDVYGFAKPTKVTFSDTVTHIVDISSGDEEEDEEEEESEVQALIVSDTPLRAPVVKTHPSFVQGASSPGNVPPSPHLSHSSSPNSSATRSDRKLYPNLATNISIAGPYSQDYSSVHRKNSQTAEHLTDFFISEELPYCNPNSMSSNVPTLYGPNASYLSLNAGPHSLKSDKSSIKNPVSGKYPSTASTSSHIVPSSQVKNPRGFTRFNSVSELHSSTAANIPITCSNPIDSNIISRNSGMRSSIASIVSTPQVHCANVTSLNSSKLSPLTRSKTPSSISLNSPVYDTSLNLHIAKTSVTTLTDTATLESVTRVSESYESYRLPPHLKVSATPLHSTVNNKPVSIQSSDIFISSGSTNLSLSSNRNSGVKISEIDDGLPNFSGNNYDRFTTTIGDSTLDFANRIQASNSAKIVPTSVKLSDTRDRSLPAPASSQSTVSPLQIKSTKVSSVSTAFPLLNIHSNSSQPMPKLFCGPPLTVKPIIASKPEVLNSSPPHMKVRNPPLFLNSIPSSRTRNQSTDSKPLSSNPPLLRLSGKDLKDSPLLQIGNPSVSKQNQSNINSISQNVDSFMSPKISLKPESRIHHKENVHSLSHLELNSTLRSPESYTSQIQKSNSQFSPPLPPSSVEVPQTAPHALEVSRSGGSTVAPSAVQSGSSQDLDQYNLPKSLSDKVLLRKFGQDGALEEEEMVANIKVVHFGVV